MNKWIEIFLVLIIILIAILIIIVIDHNKGLCDIQIPDTNTEYQDRKCESNGDIYECHGFLRSKYNV